MSAWKGVPKGVHNIDMLIISCNFCEYRPCHLLSDKIVAPLLFDYVCFYDFRLIETISPGMYGPTESESVMSKTKLRSFLLAILK